jgi:dTMP kinase
MSLFITFEGGEGCGKSTQAKILVMRLRKQKKWGVTYAEEPGTTLLGRQVREWLHEPNRPLTVIPKSNSQLPLMDNAGNHALPAIHLRADSPRAELLAFILARSQLVEECIIPKLEGNGIVVCNRYADSTTVYQGYGRGLDLKLIGIANNIATQGLKPDLTILLDLPPERGFLRKFGDIRDNFERELLDFHKKIHQGYLELASKEPERWFVIDASQSKEIVAAIIWQKVSHLLHRGA